MATSGQMAPAPAPVAKMGYEPGPGEGPIQRIRITLSSRNLRALEKGEGGMWTGHVDNFGLLNIVGFVLCCFAFLGAHVDVCDGWDWVFGVMITEQCSL
mmetsp:Transcript_12029/g.24505  ORF Transcript_12029/g.24505 Transcript_12029/m.24505 type:complete len:99 (-) Transcript_12029:1195-1491(-)